METKSTKRKKRKVGDLGTTESENLEVFESRSLDERNCIVYMNQVRQKCPLNSGFDRQVGRKIQVYEPCDPGQGRYSKIAVGITKKRPTLLLESFSDER